MTVRLTRGHHKVKHLAQKPALIISDSNFFNVMKHSIHLGKGEIQKKNQVKMVCYDMSFQQDIQSFNVLETEWSRFLTS